MSFVLSCLGKYKVGIVEPERILRKVTCILPVLLVLLYFGKHSVSHAIDNLVRNRTSFSGPFVETSRSMFSYIEKNIETKSTVVFFKPRAMRMMTGRRSLMINKVGGLSDGDYLSFYQSDKVYLDQILPDEVRCLAEKGIIQEVYRNRDFVVYRLTKSHNNALHTDGDCAALHPRR
jgi:hypothetical protein